MVDTEAAASAPGPTPRPASAPALVAPPERASARKHRAILAAAEEMFLRSGYLGTNMDELAARSQVSKQTVYKHFGSKEALFVELVTSMTDAASSSVHNEIPDAAAAADVPDYLRDYAERQLAVVMTPRLLQLRRLVIGEVSRFPELARALYESGPRRAMDSLAAAFARLDERGLLRVPDPDAAASHFNWLVMGEPVNRAMLLGDAAIPDEDWRRKHVHDAVNVFLAAYGRG